MPGHPPAYPFCILCVSPNTQAKEYLLEILQYLDTGDASPSQQVHVVQSLEDTMAETDRLLPDVLYLFEEAFSPIQGSLQEQVALFCQHQAVPPGTSPVILFETGQKEASQRMDLLLAGVDEVLDVGMSRQEKAIRLMVHLRRQADWLLDPLTRFPGLAATSKLLQRRINAGSLQTRTDASESSSSWAMLSISLKHFDVYQDVYGFFPGSQVLKTFSALLQRFILPPDVLGYLGESHTFVVLTHPERAEKMAAILCRQFDTVAPNFYSEKDKKRGYLVSAEADQASRRVPLLSLSIGIVNDQTYLQGVTSPQAVFAAANALRSLAALMPTSAWVSDRRQLTGNAYCMQQTSRQVLVLESDAAMAYLLKATLEMEGYGVTTVSGISDASQFLSQQSYALVLLDALLEGETNGWTFCKEVRNQQPACKIIFISSIHNRERALDAGADLYLPKPFELVSLFQWIHRLLG